MPRSRTWRRTGDTVPRARTLTFARHAAVGAAVTLVLVLVLVRPAESAPVVAAHHRPTTCGSGRSSQVSPVLPDAHAIPTSFAGVGGTRLVVCSAVRACTVDRCLVTPLRPESARAGVTSLAGVIRCEGRLACRVDASAVEPTADYLSVSVLRRTLVQQPSFAERPHPTAAPLPYPPSKYPTFGRALERNVLVAGGTCHGGR